MRLRERDKRELMEKKRCLKGGNIWIEDDLTWEKRSRWRFREAGGWRRRGEGRRGMVVNGKVMIEGEWWF